MAICRCEEHAPSNNRTKEYTHYVFPLGYPHASSICGGISKRCQKTGLIYITIEEFNAFQNGQRVFDFQSNTSKVIVDNTPPEVL